MSNDFAAERFCFSIRLKNRREKARNLGKRKIFARWKSPWNENKFSMEITRVTYVIKIRLSAGTLITLVYSLCTDFQISFKFRQQKVSHDMHNWTFINRLRMFMPYNFIFLSTQPKQIFHSLKTITIYIGYFTCPCTFPTFLHSNCKKNPLSPMWIAVPSVKL